MSQDRKTNVSPPSATASGAPPTAPVVVLLGAGASIEAGVPATGEITRLLAEFSHHFDDDDAVNIENLIRHVQVRVGTFRGLPASLVDFELTLGALAELAHNQLSVAFSLFTNDDPVLGAASQESQLLDRVNRMFAIVRSLMDVPPESGAYLDSLLDLRPAGRPLDVFTLNYDRTIEEMAARRSLRIADGFQRLKAPFGTELWSAANFDRQVRVSLRLYKLHGSVDWAVVGAQAPPTTGHLHAESYLRSYPRLVRLKRWRDITFAPPGALEGVISAMNFGTRKELMYASTPFTEMFERFRASLSEADLLIVAGYSFRDERINRLVEEAIALRRGELRLLIVDPNCHRLLDALPTLWEFVRADVAETIALPLGDALRAGVLRTAARKLLKRNLPETDWGSGLMAIPVPVTSNRDPDEVCARWSEIRRFADALVLKHDRARARLRDAAGSWPTEPSEIATGFQQLIQEVHGMMDSLDRTYVAMGYSPRYGDDRLRLTNFAPRQTGHQQVDKRTFDLLDELARWSSAAYLSYHFRTDEFTSGVQDPNYGKDVGAPDNFSLAAFAIGDVAKPVEDLVAVLDDVFIHLGYESPFQRAEQGWPPGR